MNKPPATISPRRRSTSSGTAAAATTADSSSNSTANPPAPTGEPAPRVLVRLPAIKQTPAASKAAAPADAHRGSTNSSSILFTPLSAGGDADAAKPSDTTDARPWYARLNTPRMQKYLPYATALVVLVVMFVWMRHHGNNQGKSKPVVPELDMPVWNTLPGQASRQVSGPARSGTPTTSWNTSASPGPALSSNAPVPGTSPSGLAAPPASANAATAGPVLPDGFQTNAAPPAWQGASSPAGGPNASSGPPPDPVPTMPAHNPSLPAPPSSDPGIVQNAQNGPGGYRTAAVQDPATIPPGRGSPYPASPGMAQFQGTIAPPQQ